MSKVKIVLNGQNYLVEKKQSILQLIEELNLDMSKVAVEKNYQIIIADDFSENTLEQGDIIEIVHFIGGG